MSNLNKLFAATALVGTIEATTACAEYCELTSKNANSPELATAADVLTYCEANKNAAIACLTVSENENGDKVDCTAPVYQCNEPALEQNINDLFATGGGQYCVEDPAQLQANL